MGPTLLIAALVFFVILVIWAGMRNRRLTSSAPVPVAGEIEFSTSEGDGWYDLKFHFTVSSSGESRAFRLRNHFEDAEVGMTVVIPHTIQNGLRQDEKGQWYVAQEAIQTVLFVRDGEPSDRLVRAMNRLYKTGLTGKRMVDVVSLEAIPLEGEQQGLPKIKLFGGPNEDEEAYFELYLNLDFQRSVAEIAEKDPDYRLPMMKALVAA